MIKERIRKIIEHEKISFSKFADIIGMQRSGVSHILSGRNNPSLDVIQNILESFSYINAEWLISGKGNMFKPSEQSRLFDKTTDNEEVINDQKRKKQINSNSEKYSDTNSNSKKISNSHDVNLDREIDRVIIFFKDNSFKEYKNRK